MKKLFFILIPFLLIGCASTPTIEPTEMQEITIFNNCPWNCNLEIGFINTKLPYTEYKLSSNSITVNVYKGVEISIHVKGVYDSKWHFLKISDLRDAEYQWLLDWSTSSARYVIRRYDK